MSKQDLTIKDLQLRMMDKVDNIKSVQDAHVASTIETLKGIENHLAQLNSKVAMHEKKLHSFENFKTKATAYATIGAAGISIIINKII